MTPAQLEQAMTALDRANKVRSDNSQMCRAISTMNRHDGLLAIAEIIENPTPQQAAIPVDRLLKSVHSFGRIKAVRVLEFAQVRTGQLRIGEMTARQRLAIATRLRGMT